MRYRPSLWLVLVGSIVLWSCEREQDTVSGASVVSGTGSMRIDAEGLPLAVEEIANTGEVIWAMDFVDARTMIFTERRGVTRTLDLETGEIVTLDGGPDVFFTDSGGLFDILVDPAFAENGRLFWTYVKGSDKRSTTAVATGTLRDGRITGVRDLFVANNGSDDHAHWGARVVMDADRKLFVAIGERHVPDNAQDLSSHAGKIVRLNEDGGIPADNPFVATPGAAPEIWSLGHRNPQGLAIQPGTGVLFVQEHGPTGGDEINLVRKGANYGWPRATHGENIWGGQLPEGTALPGLEPPAKYWVPGVAPTGLAFYTGDRMPGWRGSLLSSTLRGPLVRTAVDGNEFGEESRYLTDWIERARDIAAGPDGLLYLATETGKIYRIGPLQ